MKFEISERLLYILMMDAIVFLVEIAYLIFEFLSQSALEMSTFMRPLDESGLFVLFAAARLIIQIAVVIAVLANILYIMVEIEKWRRKYWRDNL